MAFSIIVEEYLFLKVINFFKIKTYSFVYILPVTSGKTSTKN